MEIKSENTNKNANNAGNPNNDSLADQVLEISISKIHVADFGRRTDDEEEPPKARSIKKGRKARKA